MSSEFKKKLLIFGLAVALLYGISRCWTAPERVYQYSADQTGTVAAHTG